MRSTESAIRIGILLATAGGMVSCDPQPIPTVRLLNPEHAFLADVCADGATLDGMDVSVHQGLIDWDQVAADGIEFAFIRISDGMTPLDDDFEYNWVEAKRVGILRGIYQFYRSNEDPIDQANLTIQFMQNHGSGELPPVADVESTDGMTPSEIAARLQQWLDRVETQTGIAPLIYTSPGWWNSNVVSDAFGAYPLWIAHWGPVCPDTPNGWTDWVVHQTTNSGVVAGISGGVDLDLFNGDHATMAAFAITSLSCGDGLCTNGETTTSCPVDCLCQPVGEVAKIIDETDVCFTRFGELQYWNVESGVGQESSLLWTHAVSGPATNNTGTWRIEVEAAGTYRVEAFILNPSSWESGTNGQSTQAGYFVDHAGGTSSVVISQQQANGWTELGEFELVTGSGQGVRLVDATGEAYSDRIQLLFDAVRVTPLDVPGSDGGPTGGDTDEPIGGDSFVPTGGDSFEPSGGDSFEPITTGDGSSPSSGGDTSLSRRDPPTGCSCRATDQSWAGGVVLAALLLVLRRRRWN